ncbi:MAG: hypothetical protein LC746_09560 [Acidobacteria bacterium]|nr:hypothetical protein [Acidobacteriota bacterium]
MKSLRWTLLLILLASVAAAQKSSDPAKERDARVKDGFVVKVGEELRIEREGLKITFVSVKDDSRCPEGATCVWAGNARAHVSVRDAKGDCAEFDLNTNLTPKDYDFGAYKIALAELSPHPSVKHQPKPDEYVATLVVTKEVKK